MAERVTVEQNGERITLEVPDGTSDEQIQSFLSGGAPSSTPKQTTIGDVADKAFQTALPATYVPGPTGAAQLASELKEAQVFKPVVDAAALPHVTHSLLRLSGSNLLSIRFTAQ